MPSLHGNHKTHQCVEWALRVPAFQAAIMQPVQQQQNVPSIPCQALLVSACLEESTYKFVSHHDYPCFNVFSLGDVIGQNIPEPFSSLFCGGNGKGTGRGYPIDCIVIPQMIVAVLFKSSVRCHIYIYMYTHVYIYIQRFLLCMILQLLLLDRGCWKINLHSCSRVQLSGFDRLYCTHHIRFLLQRSDFGFESACSMRAYVELTQYIYIHMQREREGARESADCTALCVALKCSLLFRMVAEGDLWVDWTGSKSETPTA